MSNTARGPLGLGARVGAFVVREEIGFGATSIVYEAEHRTLRHLVAVKVLRSSSDMDTELRLRFEREMRLCTSLSSLHVPHVYEVGELPSGLPYIVMERLDGSTLAEWLATHRKLPVAVVVEIGIQLCAALTALHERQVLHRDVKPENLVLHRAFSDGCVLKLVDFGICKPLVSDGLSLTRRGTVVGTPEYMSPEQVQGIEVDARTDVYSTGVVLYELLAGRTPFEGRDLDLLGRAILFANPPRLSAVRPEVSAVLEGIVMRAMARERTDRHPTMGALKRELERFAEEQALRRHPAVWGLMPSASPQAPPPPPRGERSTNTTLSIPRIPMRRGGMVAAAGGLLGVILTAGLAVAYYVYDPFADRRLDPSGVPFVPEPQPSATYAPTALDLGPLAPPPAGPSTPTAVSPVPVREASRITPAAISETPPGASLPASEPTTRGEAELASEVASEPSASLERAAPRRRARAERRALRRRAAREAQGELATTVAFGPSAPLPSDPGVGITAAELYEQVDATGGEPAATERESFAAHVPNSPYAAGSGSPLDDDLRLVDPF